MLAASSGSFGMVWRPATTIRATKGNHSQTSIRMRTTKAPTEPLRAPRLAMWSLLQDEGEVAELGVQREVEHEPDDEGRQDHG